MTRTGNAFRNSRRASVVRASWSPRSWPWPPPAGATQRSPIITGIERVVADRRPARGV